MESFSLQKTGMSRRLSHCFILVYCTSQVLWSHANPAKIDPELGLTATRTGSLVQRLCEDVRQVAETFHEKRNYAARAKGGTQTCFVSVLGMTTVRDLRLPAGPVQEFIKAWPCRFQECCSHVQRFPCASCLTRSLASRGTGRQLV